jgi:hypothetical protein
LRITLRWIVTSEQCPFFREILELGYQIGSVMTLQELEHKLVAVAVPKDAYCLSGGVPNETYCIERTADSWNVYYSERGSRSELRRFSSEDDACKYLYALLTKRPA